MSSIGENIKKARKLAGMTQKELGSKLGVTQQNIAQYENNIAKPKIETISKIAEALNTSVGSLMGNIYNLEPENNRPTSKAVRIPVLGSIPAGIPIEEIKDIVDFEDIPREWTRENAEYFGLKINDSSMYPKYLENDTVILRKQDDCESGQDCVVYINSDDAVFKKVLKQHDGIILQSLNPEYMPILCLYKDKNCKIRIVGIAIEIRRKV